MTNTLIFKENLKIITSKLIDTIWKEKIKSEKIQQTIQKAFCQMYKGGFEEIKELDEEHLYNSWVNSCENTERILTDPLGSSQKITPAKNIFDEPEKTEILLEEKENDGDKVNLTDLPKQKDEQMVNLEIPKYYYQNFGKTKKDKKMSPPKSFLKEEPKKIKNDKKKVKSFFCRNKDVDATYMPRDLENSKGSINKHNSVEIKQNKKNGRNFSGKIKKLENGVSKHGFDLFENQLKSLHFKTKSEEARNKQMKKLKKRYNKSFKIQDFNEKKMFHSTRNPLKYIPKTTNLTCGNNIKKKKSENFEVKDKLKKRIKKLFKKKKVTEKIICKKSDNFHLRNRSYNSISKKEFEKKKTSDNYNSVKNSIGYQNQRKPINSKHFRNPLKK